MLYGRETVVSRANAESRVVNVQSLSSSIACIPRAWWEAFIRRVSAIVLSRRRTGSRSWSGS